MNTPTLIAISPEEVERIEKERDEYRELALKQQKLLSKIAAERDDYKRAYENGAELALKKSVPFEKMKAFLNVFLDEFEGDFDSDERCTSNEIAVHYMAAAKFMKEHFGRDDAKRIEQVQAWVDLPEFEKSYKS